MRPPQGLLPATPRAGQSRLRRLMDDNCPVCGCRMVDDDFFPPYVCICGGRSDRLPTLPEDVTEEIWAAVEEATLFRSEF